MNVQEKIKIGTVQMSFSPELDTCESEELKQREEGCCHDFLHEIITHCKINQVNAWFRLKTFHALLNNMLQHPPFTWRSGQKHKFFLPILLALSENLMSCLEPVHLEDVQWGYRFGVQVYTTTISKV